MAPRSDIQVSANKKATGGMLAGTLRTAFSYVRGKLMPMRDD
jgi:hypothetical protein